MYTLGIDTSHKYLVIALMDDDKVIGKVQDECLKKQSEYILPAMDNLLKQHGLSSDDVGSICLAKGPGSYTGVRIGMTIAKVLGSIKNVDVYTISTLQLYAGLKKCYSFIDARANRVYIGNYDNGKAVMDDTIYTLDKLKEVMASGENQFVGDLHLVGASDEYGDLCENFLALKPYWEKVENIDTLVPVYLKSNQEYLK